MTGSAVICQFTLVKGDNFGAQTQLLLKNSVLGVIQDEIISVVLQRAISFKHLGSEAASPSLCQYLGQTIFSVTVVDFRFSSSISM